MFRPFWDLKPKTAKDSSAGERTFNIATEEVGGFEQIGSFQRRFRSGTGRKQLLFCAPVQGAGIAMEETFIPRPEFFDASFHCSASRRQEHCKFPFGHRSVRPQGVVGIDDGVGALQLPELVKVRVFTAGVGKGGW